MASVPNDAAEMAIKMIPVSLLIAGNYTALNRKLCFLNAVYTRKKLPVEGEFMLKPRLETDLFCDVKTHSKSLADKRFDLCQAVAPWRDPCSS